MSYGYKLDCFSGEVADLKPKQRTEADIVRCLRTHPRVSVWDMDKKWLRDSLASLVRRGLITEDKTEQYPWLRYNVAAEPNAQVQRRP